MFLLDFFVAALFSCRLSVICSYVRICCAVESSILFRLKLFVRRIVSSPHLILLQVVHFRGSDALVLFKELSDCIGQKQVLPPASSTQSNHDNKSATYFVCWFPQDCIETRIGRCIYVERCCWWCPTQHFQSIIMHTVLDDT